MTPSVMEPKWLSDATKGRLILAALWLLAAAALVVFRQVLLPFAIAFIVAYLLEPAVERMAAVRIRGRRVPRWSAVLGLYAVFFLALYLFGRIAVPQLYGELAALTKQGKDFVNALTPERINAFADRIESWLFSRGIPVELTTPPSDELNHYGLSLDIEHSIRQGLDHLSAALRTHFLDAVGFVQRVIGGVLGFVFRFFFVLMVAAFMLVDWRRFGDFALSLVPPEHRGDLSELLSSIDQRLAGVVRGQAMICLVNGSLTALGLLVLRVPFVFVLSTVATVLAAIPIFGTVISSVPIVLIALTQGFKTGLGMLLWIVGIHALEAYLLNPKIMGAHAQIHPVLVAFSLLAGEAMFGFVGALFAVPVAGILVAIFALAHDRALRKLEPPQ